MVLVSCWGARRMSLPTERLRPSPTPATRSGRLTPPPAAVASFPKLSPTVRVGSTKKERAKSPLFLVLVTGLEPVRVLPQGILSFLVSADFNGR